MDTMTPYPSMPSKAHQQIPVKQIMALLLRLNIWIKIINSTYQSINGTMSYSTQLGLLRMTITYTHIVKSSENKMFLWNTDAPASNKVQIHVVAKSQYLIFMIFWPHLTIRACDVNVLWATLRSTCSPSLVTVSPSKLYNMSAGWNYGWTDRQTIWQTDRQTSNC